jgi:ferredoxin
VGTESYGNSEYVFCNSRLKEAAGPYYRNFNRNLSVIELEKPFKRKVAVLKDVLDADVYISVPKMKTHGLTMISGAVKNNYGLLTGGQKAWYHYYCVTPEKFAEIVIEMFRLRPPDLVIMDAILSMEGYGPASPETRRVNKVLASDDAVALDRVETQIVGFNLEDIPYLRLARDLSLGETDMDRIEVIGHADVIAEYHRPTPPESSYSYKAGVGSGRTTIDFYRQRVAYRPSISAQTCQHRQGCSACIDICPSGALSIGSGTPGLAPAKCMLCSACREVCGFSGLELVPDEAILSSLA